MAIEDTVYSVLSGAAGVTALVPASRIKPKDPKYQALDRPYIVYCPIADELTQTHDSFGLDMILHYPHFQISIVANSYTSVRAVSDAVKAAIGANNGNHGGTQFKYNEGLFLDQNADLGIIEFAQDYEVWL